MRKSMVIETRKKPKTNVNTFRDSPLASSRNQNKIHNVNESRIILIRILFYVENLFRITVEDLSFYNFRPKSYLVKNPQGY